jgi:hypothetical protein
MELQIRKPRQFNWEQSMMKMYKSTHKTCPKLMRKNEGRFQLLSWLQDFLSMGKNPTCKKMGINLKKFQKYSNLHVKD